MDASRELVFRAWTEAEHLARWWGPNGFSNTFEEFRPTPGGIWRLVMHGPDGTDYPNENRFVDVVKPERVVLEHSSPPRFELRATFEARGPKTDVTWRMRFESAEEAAQLRDFIAEKSNENLDRLQTELKRMS